MFSKRREVIKILPFGEQPQFYTTNSKPITWAGTTYQPVSGLKRSKFNQEDNGLSEAVTVSFPASNAWAKRFRDTRDFPLTRVIVMRSKDGGQTFRNRFSGKVNAVQGSGSRIELKCENGYQSSKRDALSNAILVSCPYSIYDEDCRLDENAYKRNATIAQKLSTSEYRVTGLEANPDDYFQAGMLKFGAVWRTIRLDKGNVLTLDIDLEDIPVGTVVEVYPGCRQSFDICHNTFNNTINNGGFRNIPSASPVSGISII